MKSTFRVLFFLKRDKVKKNGNMPIMARVTIDGKLAQFNTKLEVNPKNWSAKTGKVNGRGAEFTRMNEMLDSIKATLHRHYQTILERDNYVTAEKGVTYSWARKKRQRHSYRYFPNTMNSTH